MNTGTLSSQSAAPTETVRSQTPTPWRQVWPGVFYFVLVGSVLVLSEVLQSWGRSEIFGEISSAMWFFGCLIVLVGALIGWLRGFPRWSYPYLANSLLIAIFLPFIHTRGFVFFGVPIWGEGLLGLRAWIPVLLVLPLGWALTRGKPSLLVQLLDSWIWDWMVWAFGFYSWIPLALQVILDENYIGPSFSFPALLAGSLLTIIGSLIFLRAASRRTALIGLFAGAFTAVYTVSLSSSLYWAL